MAKDIYSDLLPTPAPIGGEKDPYAPSIFDDLFDQPDEMTMRLRRSMQVAVTQNPDRFASSFKLAKQAGVTPEIVDVDKLGWESTVNFNKLDFKKIAKYDAFAEWLTDPANASVAVDDLDALTVAVDHITQANNTKESWFGSIGKAFKSSGVYGVKKNITLAQYGLTMSDPDAVAQELANLTRLQQRIEARKPEYVSEYEKRRAQIGKEAVRVSAEDTGYTQGYFLHNITGGRLNVNPVQVGKGALKYIWNAITSKGSVPAETEAISGSWPTIGASVGAGTAAAVTTGGIAVPAAMAGATMVVETPLEYGSWVEKRLVEAGVDMTDEDAIYDKLNDPAFFSEVSAEAKRKAIGTAAVDSLMAAFGGKLVAGSVRKGAEEAGKAAVKQTAMQTAKTVATNAAPAFALEQAGQMVGGAASEYVGQAAAVGGENVDWNDVFQEGMAEVFFGGAEVVAGAALHSTAMPREKALQLAKETIAAYQGYNAYEALKAGVEAYSQTRLAVRSPEHLAALQKAVGGDKPVQFNVADIEEFAAANGLSAPQLVEELTGEATAFADSKSFGVNVNIPMGELTKTLYAATDKNAADKLMQSANILGMSALQAKEFAQSAEKRMQEIEVEQDKINEIFNSVISEGSKDFTEENITSQERTARLGRAAKKQIQMHLEKVGQTPALASSNAAMIAARIMTLHERSGLDPEQIMATLPGIIGKKQTERMDIDIDRIRSGKLPTDAEIGGKSLVQFLRERGGLKDVGGELSYMDARRYPGLINAEGMPLDTAASLAAAEGYPVTELDPSGRGSTEATANMLLEAIRSELSGKPVYSEANIDYGRMQYRDSLLSMADEISRMGLDIQTASNEEIKAAFDRAATGDVFEQVSPEQAPMPDEIEIDGKMRSTLNSKGQRIAATEEQVRNFWKWFGDSKVVDADGRPLVVYHGSGKSFDSFDAKKRGSATGARSAKLAFFFVDSVETASKYAESSEDFATTTAYEKIERLERAGRYDEADELNRKIESGEYDFGVSPQVYAVYLKIEKPFEYDFKGARYSPDDHNLGDMIYDAKNIGNDGAIFRRFEDNPSQGGPIADHFAAFEPTQIKSATGNRGTFSASDPSILNQPAYHGSSSTDKIYYDAGDAGPGEIQTEQRADGNGRAEARRRNYEITGQASLFDDPEVKAEQELARGDTRPLDDKALKNLLDGLGGELKPGNRLSNLVSGVANDEIPTAVLRGSVVKSPSDAAALLAAFRSPFVERTSWLLVGKDGAVKNNGLYSIGTIDSAEMPSKDALDAILAKTSAEPGDTMIWAHNHPSGDPTPSQADMYVYSGILSHLQKKGINFDGMVLNGSEFYYNVTKDLYSKPSRGSYDGGSQFHTVQPGATLKNADALASWIKSLSVSPGSSIAIHTDPRLKVVGVEAWQNPPSNQEINESRQSVAGAQTFVVVPGSNPYSEKGQSRIPDVIVLRENGYYESQAAIGKYRSQIEDDKANNVNIVRQPAYHGTGNVDVYDRFRYDLVGGPGGEGAQAYGWGLYFTSQKQVAQHYREKLSGSEVIVNGRTIADAVNDTPFSEAWFEIESTLREARGNVEAAVNMAEAAINSWSAQSGDATKDWNVNRWTNVRDWIKTLKKGDVEIKEGKLYQVDIPEDSEYLDWDKPLEEQSLGVQEKLKSIGKEIWDELDEMLDEKMQNPISGMDSGYTGKELYKLLSRAESIEYVGDGKGQNASEMLRSIGIPGITYLGEYKKTAGEGARNYVIFDDSRISIQAYEQASGEAAGQFNPNTNIITMFQADNPSTFMHEAGHWFLDSQEKIVALLEALPQKSEQQQKLIDDWNATLQYLGTDAQSWSKMSIDQRRTYHEKMAELFEAYIMRGIAPSKQLEGVMARMSEWIKTWYRAVTKMLGLAKDMNPEIVEIMDRIFATDKEIADAAALVDISLPGETKEMAEMRLAARREAEAEMRKVIMKEVSADNRRARFQARKEIEPEVRKEVSAEPVYAAMDIMRGNIEGVEGFKIRTSDAKDALSEERWSKVRRMGLTNEEGISPSDAAVLFGFESGDALLFALADAEPKSVRVNRIVTQRVDELFPTMMSSPLEMSEEAMKAVHNERRTQLIEMEMANLAEMVAEKTQAETAGRKDSALRTAQATMQAIRKTAKARISEMKVKSIVPNQYLRAERRYAKEAFDLAVAGKIEEALEAKRKQAVNAALYSEARNAVELIEKITKRIDASQQKRIQGILGKEDINFQDRVNTIAEWYGFNAQRPEYAERKARIISYLDKLTKKLSAAVDAKKDEAVIVDDSLDEELLRKIVADDSSFTDGKWRDVSLDELKSVDDAIRNVIHQARRLGKMNAAHRDELLADVITKIKIETEANNKKLPTVKQKPEQSKWYKLANSLRSFKSWNTTIQGLSEIIGGGKQGKFWEYLVRPFNEASDREVTMRQDAFGKLHEATKKMGDSRNGKKSKVFIKSMGINLEFETRLMVAMNCGNVGNRERLKSGHNSRLESFVEGDKALNDQHINEILESLSKDELDYVQAVFDLINSFWPEIAEKERRVTGVVPEKVEADGIVTSKGSWDGGYFPVVYDRSMNVGTAMSEDQDLVKRLFMGDIARPQTKRNHVLARSVGRGVPLKLSFDVVGQHISNVIHDLTHHEVLLDFTRVYNNREFANTIKDYFGDAALREMREMAAYVASGGPRKNWIDGIFDYVRRGQQVMVMGYSLSTALAQPAGIGNSFHRVGYAPMMRGAINLFSNPLMLKKKIADIVEVSEYMRNRHASWIQGAGEMTEKIRIELMEAGTLKTARKGYNFIQDTAMILTQKIQFLNDIVTWQSEYDRVIDENPKIDLKEAVARADQAVIDSQGSHRAHELSGVQRDRVGKLFVNFVSWTFTLWNRHAVGINGMKKAMRDGENMKAAAIFANDILSLYIIPIAIMTAGAIAMGKGPKEDEEYSEWLAKKVAKEGAGMIPIIGLREAASLTTQNLVSGKRDAAMTPLSSALNTVSNLTVQASQGEMDKAFVGAGLDAVGTFGKLPTTQLERTINGFIYYNEHPEDDRADARNFFFGPPPKK